MLERRGDVFASTGVDGRRLDDRAARRDEPVEALALGQLAERSGSLTSRADLRNAREMPMHGGDVDRRVERPQTRLVELDARFERVLLAAPDDDTGVHELLALDPGHDPDHRVVIGAR